jgi:hypothetical protein
MKKILLTEPPFTQIDKTLYGEVIHICTPEEHDHYNAYVDFFGTDENDFEKYDELP